MTQKNNTKSNEPLWRRVYNFASAKGVQGYKWLYDNPYSYVRVVLLAGLAGMWVFDYVKSHITMGDVQAVSAVVAVIVTAHLLGGLKVFKKG